MIRFHVHVTTLDLPSSIRAYSQVFGPPVLTMPDYAKWEPDGFPVIFAVSTRKGGSRIDRLGIKADSKAALAAMRAGLEAQGLRRVEQRDAECCYARADKLWVPSLSIGPSFHFLPRAFLDPFVSLRGGLAWPFENGTAVQLSPFVAASAGVTVYYWGIFFAEVEGGYQLTALSQPTRSVDLGGAFVSLRFGLAL